MMLLRVAALASLALSIGAGPLDGAPRFPQASLASLGAVKFTSENDDDANLAGVQLFFSAGLERQSASQNGLAALTAESLLRTPVDGVALRYAIGLRGATIEYTVDARQARYYLEAPPKTLPDVIALFGRALSSPDFSAATVAAAAGTLGERIKESEGNALSVGVEMFRRSYYATGAGFPTFGTTASLAALTSNDVASFYRVNYKRSGLSASAVGKMMPAIADAIASLADLLADGQVPSVVPKVRPLPANPLRIVARRDVGAPIIVVGFGAPSPASKDFGAMVVLQTLLANAFERSSATTLGVVERSVGASYLYDGTPASLIVYVNGNRVDPSLAIRELFVVSKSLATQPLTAPSLRGMKTSAEGAFIVDAVTLSDRSYLLGTLAAQGLGPDPVNAALAAIERTTAADVQRVAKRYLQRYIVALVLPRSAPES